MTNPRISLSSETMSLVLIDSLSSSGVMDDGAEFDRRVLLDWYRTDFPNLMRQYFELDGRISPTNLKAELLKRSRNKPRRWEDLSDRFRRVLLLLSARQDTKCFRAFTLWIGEDLIAEARTSDRPLVDHLRKRMADRLRRHLGSNEFGFWFHLERTKSDPYGLHVHGIIYVKDHKHLTIDRRYRELRREITQASGSNHKMVPSRILDMKSKDINQLWMDYCLKQRRDRRFHTSNSTPPPLDVGERLHAGTHSFTRRAQTFYKRIRLVVPALLNGKIKTWTKEEWDAVGWYIPLGKDL
tara:strand:- start:106 stop:996 length:891 start_codon:yes stop_codon:yes gene_type:complete